MRQNLRELRERQRLTQAKMAKAVGITARQYQSIEAGNSYGSVQVWERIRDVLGGTIDDLLKNTI